MIPGIPDWIINVIVASTILVVGIWFAYFISRFVRRKAFEHPRVDRTLSNFFALMIRYALIIIVLLVVLQQFGIETTSLVAVVGASALAIGLALQGTLTNVASGIMLALMRPFHIGDFVEINGREGTVTDLDLFFTQIRSPNDRMVYVPNGSIVSNPIVNFTRGGLRRSIIAIGVGYEDDLDQAIAVMRDIIEGDERTKAQPEPTFRVSELADSSVVIEACSSIVTADYGAYKGDMLKAIKEAFDREGIEIPYPHAVEMSKGDMPRRDPPIKKSTKKK